jgi:riboflavin synthase
VFTGLVEEIGRLVRTERRGTGPAGGARLVIEMRARPLVLGESIAVDGVCLTVDRIASQGFEADASSETLARTTLGDRTSGDRVHLERATQLGGRMGGHIVAGHVDGKGVVVELRPLGEARRLALRIDAEPHGRTRGHESRSDGSGSGADERGEALLRKLREGGFA